MKRYVHIPFLTNVRSSWKKSSPCINNYSFWDRAGRRMSAAEVSGWHGMAGRKPAGIEYAGQVGKGRTNGEAGLDGYKKPGPSKMGIPVGYYRYVTDEFVGRLILIGCNLHQLISRLDGLAKFDMDFLHRAADFAGQRRLHLHGL